VRATLTVSGRPARGKTVVLRGPGFRRAGKTDRRGRVRFTVRSRRSGRATVSATACGGRLAVRAAGLYSGLG
jgi:hypothetical protein